MRAVVASLAVLSVAVVVVAVDVAPAGASSTQITLTDSMGDPDRGETSNARDGNLSTATYTTPSNNTQLPSHLMFGFASTSVNRIRLYKDTEYGAHNLTIQYTTDPGSLDGRTWTTVTGLSNGYNRTELMSGTVNSNGTVTSDTHDSPGGAGFASLMFDTVTATGLRISFTTGHPNVHYHVYEFEAHYVDVATFLTVSPATPDGGGGWYLTPPTITATPFAPAGLDEMRCVLDPAVAPATFDDMGSGCTYSGGAAAPDNGVHTVYAATRDINDATHPPATLSLQIDQLEPQTTIDLSGTLNGTHYTSDVTPTITAGDTHSGVSESRCAVDPVTPPSSFDDLTTDCGDVSGGTVEGNGQHTIYAASKDIAGNKEAPVSSTFEIDYETASITIVKNSVPDHAQDVHFNTTGSGLSSFFLDDDANPTLSNTKVFANLPAGSYSVTETPIPAGWVRTGLVCNTGESIAGATATITLATAEAVTCTYTNTRRQPDAMVKKSAEANSAYAKNDFYSTAVTTTQTKSQNVKRNATVTFQVLVQNDGALDSFKVTGPKSSTGFTVTYLRGAANITNAVTSAAGYTINNLPAGGVVTLTVKIKAASNARIGASKNVDLTVASKTLTSRKDLVRAKATVVR